MGRQIEIEGHLDCKQCHLYMTRTQVVPGFGNPKSKIVFVGEAPGEDEDKIGRPFVGEAGQLLRAIIDAAGLDSSEMFYTNIYQCRPPQNKIVHAAGSPCPDIWMQSELRVVKPKMIIACGKTATTYFWPDERKTLMRDLVGRVDMNYDLEAIVMSIYHPSYALRLGKHDWEENKAIQSMLTHITLARKSLPFLPDDLTGILRSGIIATSVE